MAYPQTYNRNYDFASYQNTNPTRPLPGARVNLELNDIQRAVGEIITTLRGVTRSDGVLANGSVGLDQLSPEAIMGLEAPTVWAAATDYTAGNTVFNGAVLYRATVDHTSVEPFDATKWDELADLTSVFNSLSADLDEAVDTAEAAAVAAAASAEAAAAFAGANATVFSTNTSAAATAIPAGVVPLIRTGGRAMPDDNGGGFFLEVDDEPDHEPKFQHLGNAKWRKLVGFSRPAETVLTPEMFSESATNTSAGNTAAFAKLVAHANAVGRNVVVEFDGRKSYNVLGTEIAAGQTFLAQFSAIKGLKFRFNGARFRSAFDHEAVNDYVDTSNNRAAFFMHFASCEDVRALDELDFEQTATLTDTIYGSGTHLLTFGDACKGIEFPYIHMKGGVGAVFTDRGGGFDNQNRGEFFDFGALQIEDVYYGINTQRNGDRIRARIKAKNSGRAVFVISSSHAEFDVELNEQRAYAQQIYIVTACAPSDENKVFGVHVQLSGQQKGTLAQLQINQDTGTPTAGRMHDVSVHFKHIESLSGASGNLIAFGKDSDTAFGHSVEGIRFSGVTQNIGAGVAGGALFTDHNWTGENINNVFLDKLAIGGNAAALAIDGRGIGRNLSLANVDAKFVNLTLTNIADGALNVGDGVDFANFKSAGFTSPWRYRRGPAGRIRMTAKKTCANGDTNTDVTFPCTVRNTTDAWVEGLNNVSATGNADIYATVPSTGKATITRASTTGAKDVQITVDAAVAADGSPI